jgi:hypothetical protein
MTESSYLNEVGTMAVIVNATGVEPRTRPSLSEARNHSECSHNRCAVRWRCRQGNAVCTDITLNGHYLVQSGHVNVMISRDGPGTGNGPSLHVRYHQGQNESREAREECTRSI